MTITHITIVQHTGTDVVFLHTDLPGSTWPYNEPASFKLDCAQGTGPSYCAKHFMGIPVEVVCDV